ncbi:uncharacterized protein LOC124115334 [Haliotis rufescens]|uniref:uncharacterized protein LOC124115334 n=1 Tax=Haliotis rufescens TaxID=6454 RepID=UPI00201F94F4|nr:uncharacterized protein LOC124115334 [Haliotis rufescens]
MCIAIMATESTSFMQFDYCNLCKISHKKRKKHIYSKRHQEILQNILKKFEKKIQDGRVCIDNPGVEPLGWENGATFWCYFCQLEVGKHRAETDCTVKHGGLILHLASDDHAKKTGEFFWKNIIDKKKKAKYILSQDDADRFSNKADTAVTVYRHRVKTQLSQVASKIRSQAAERNQVTKRSFVMQPPWIKTSTKQISQHSAPGHVTPRMSSSHGNCHAVSVPGKKTVSAKAVGLTSINRHSDKLSEVEDGAVGEGNVFTGATPPWLMEEDEDAGSGEIGPSLPEYNKHLEREKKKKLPANRVGAKFDHKSETPASWLPSFGGVWHQGRRLNAKIQFERRTGGKAMQASSSMSQLQRQPETVIPYKRKKKNSETNTSTGIQLISSPLLKPSPQILHQYHDNVAMATPISSPFVQVQGGRTWAAVDGVGVGGADRLGQEGQTLRVGPGGSISETSACEGDTSSVEIRNNDEGSYETRKDVEVSKQHTESDTVAQDSIQRTQASNETCSSVSQPASSLSFVPVSVKNQQVRRASDDKPSIKRGLSPVEVAPYKRKKRPVRDTEPRQSTSGVGQMFTQACDHAFTQQMAAQGSRQAYPRFNNNTALSSDQSMIPPPQSHYMTPYGVHSYPGHCVNTGSSYRPTLGPSGQAVRGGNPHNNMTLVQPGFLSKDRFPGSSAPTTSHAGPHHVYMPVRPPVHRPAPFGSSAPNTSCLGSQHNYVRPPVQAIAQGSSAPATSQGNGMNLFQSISAAVRLPH